MLFIFMKNGSALMAFTEELDRYLTEFSTLDYYQQPVPSEADRRLDQALEKFMAADEKERGTFQSSLSREARSRFGIYGHRAATRAIREQRADLLQQGLVASVVANYIVPDNRRIEIGLAVYHAAALRLGHNPANLFSVAADYAAPELALQLIAFGSRGDITLKKYGWREVETPEGVEYRFSWR